MHEPEPDTNPFDSDELDLSPSPLAFGSKYDATKPLPKRKPVIPGDLDTEAQHRAKPVTLPNSTKDESGAHEGQRARLGKSGKPKSFLVGVCITAASMLAGLVGYEIDKAALTVFALWLADNWEAIGAGIGLAMVAASKIRKKS